MPSKEDQVTELGEKVVELQQQVNQLQAQIQTDSVKQNNVIQGLSHLLVDLVTQARDHESIRHQLVSQRVHNLLTSFLPPPPPPPPPPALGQHVGEIPSMGTGLYHVYNTGNMNALHEGIQIQQLRQQQRQEEISARSEITNATISATASAIQATPSKTRPVGAIEAAPKTPKTVNAIGTTTPKAIIRRGTKRKPAALEDTNIDESEEPETSTAVAATPATTATAATPSSPKRRKAAAVTTGFTGSSTSVPFNKVNTEPIDPSTFPAEWDTNPSVIGKEVAFAKAPNTVLEIWNEYIIGLDGTPSIKSLEEKYKTLWRREPCVAKKFNRRKPIYMAIERGLARGLSLQECLDLMESYRLTEGGKDGVKQPIGWLGHGNLPEELKEKQEDEAEKELKRKLAAKEIADKKIALAEKRAKAAEDKEREKLEKEKAKAEKKAALAEKKEKAKEVKAARKKAEAEASDKAAKKKADKAKKKDQGKETGKEETEENNDDDVEKETTEEPEEKDEGENEDEGEDGATPEEEEEEEE